MNIKKPNSFARYGDNYVAPLTTIDQIVKPSGERYTDKEFELMSNVENVMFGENSAGKNLLNPTLQTTTQNGVTCTNNGDGTYTLNGTATGDGCVFLLGTYSLPSGTYKLIGGPSSSIPTYYVDCRRDNGTQVIDIEGRNIFTTVGQSSKNSQLVVNAGIIFNNLVIKPMITADLNATYDDFEPYVKSLRQLTDSALNMDLLWTNASPTSEFPPQTISLDLSQYKSFVITYLSYAGNENSDAPQFYPTMGSYTYSWIYYNLNENMYRELQITTTGIRFTKCTINGTSTNNTKMIPHKIYGVR